MLIIQHFVFGWWEVAYWPEQSAIVEPLHPRQCRSLDIIQAAPGAIVVNKLCLAEPVGGLC
jgi:hypothetical protein